MKAVARWLIGHSCEWVNQKDQRRRLQVPSLEKHKKGKGEITRAPGWEYKWPQVGQQTETMKTKSVRIYPGLHVVSARTLHRSFIFVEAFQCNAKNFERAVKRRIVLYAFIAFGFLEVSLKINWCILQWNIFFLWYV